MGELRLIKRNGEIDTILKDGRWLLNDAVITIENGEIKHIDNGKWTNLDE